jgi:hypothetical protein
MPLENCGQMYFSCPWPVLVRLSDSVSKGASQSSVARFILLSAISLYLSPLTVCLDHNYLSARENTGPKGREDTNRNISHQKGALYIESRNELQNNRCAQCFSKTPLLSLKVYI